MDAPHSIEELCSLISKTLEINFGVFGKVEYSIGFSWDELVGLGLWAELNLCMKARGWTQAQLIKILGEEYVRESSYIHLLH